MIDRGHTEIKAEAILFSELFCQGKFSVPWHQRYYDWKPVDVQALLDDINDAIKEGRTCYFLGAVILVKVSSQEWEINDGQQRMVTVSLVYAALCRHFSKTRNSQFEKEALCVLFDLEYGKDLTLDNAETYTPRITPPKNDAMSYRQIIRGNTIGANGTLSDSWNVIEKFFSTMSLVQLKGYFKFLTRNLEIACLRTPSHIDPNAVYETINCRGKKLDDLDLIRNFLYSHFNAEGDADRRISIHDNLEMIRTQMSKANKASEYMRCHLQCNFGFLRKDNFYRDVRTAIRSEKEKRNVAKETMADYVFSLTKRIGSPDILELFRMLTSPTEEFIKAFETSSGTTGSQRSLEVFLRELSGYKVTQPLIFSMLLLYIREADGRKRNRIAKIIHKNFSRLATFVLRTAFVAPKFESSHFEEAFSNFAKNITIAGNIPDTDFAEFLRGCDRSEYGVLDDTKFQNILSEVRMTGVSKIKQFLLGINSKIQKDARLLHARLCSIEHILPKSPQHWGNWDGFDNIDAHDWIHRAGNLTLMGPTDNKPGLKFNGNFSKKSESYKESGIKLTRMLVKYDNWTPNVITERQQQMAKQAVQVWVFE